MTAPLVWGTACVGQVGNLRPIVNRPLASIVLAAAMPLLAQRLPATNPYTSAADLAERAKILLTESPAIAFSVNHTLI